MITRYFKGTDGQRTYFRASPTRVYRSFIVDPTCKRIEFGWQFSMHDRAPLPVVEITRQEYQALVALKHARCAREKAAYAAANPGKVIGDTWFAGDAPRNSWVDNSALPVVEG